MFILFLILGPLEVAITPFKVIQGHQFWYKLKAHMRLSISN